MFQAVRTEGHCPGGRTPWGTWVPPTEVRVLGRRDPFLPEGHPRGREHILVGEWGPLDPTEPGVYPTEATAWGACAFRVLGAEEYEVRGVPVEREGRTFRVRAPPGIHPFTGEVRIGGRGFAFRGLLLGATWRVRHWAWTKDPREGGWEETLAGPPLAELETDRPDFAWGHGGPSGAKDRFATRAETRLALPKGRYELRTLSDDGVRVLVDGRVVQEDWTWHGPKENASAVDLEAGEPEILVEHFEIDGYAVLRLDLRPVP